jgi:hypothetical protein
MRLPRTVYVQDLAYLRIYEVKEEFGQQNLKILQILIKNVIKKTFVCSDLPQRMLCQNQDLFFFFTETGSGSKSWFSMSKIWYQNPLGFEQIANIFVKPVAFSIY